MKTLDSTPWWEFIVETSAPDELGALLINAGAGGIEEIGPTSVRVFYHGGGDEAAGFALTIAELGGAVRSSCEVELRNWVQEAESQWEPLIIGDLDIVPVLDSGAHAAPRTNVPLLINPGTGFGTGHHPTTNMVLQLLQHQQVKAAAPFTKALDLGTGSGILALGASALYAVQVDAIEIDPLALENAEKNCALNITAGSRVNLILGGLDKASGRYPLIMANIYAEVLCDLEAGFRAAAAPQAKLLVSGIMASLKDLVLDAYTAWRVIEVREERGWVAVLFELP